MKIKENIPLFPFCFFFFLANFVFIKFIFIFFLNASFSPAFIFELTPLYYLPGLGNLQLLFLSLCIVIIDAYLHIKDTRKNLIRSFIPTGIMIAGLSGAMINQEFSLSNLQYYILFAALLICLMMDHKKTLEMSLSTDIEKTKLEKEKTYKFKKPEKNFIAKIRSASYYFKHDDESSSTKKLSLKKPHSPEKKDLSNETIKIKQDKKPLQKDKTKDFREDLDKILNIK